MQFGHFGDLPNERTLGFAMATLPGEWRYNYKDKYLG